MSKAKNLDVRGRRRDESSVEEIRSRGVESAAMWKFSVRSLLAVTTVAAIYIGALKAPGDGWGIPIVVVTLAIIIYGVQRIAISPSSRPFWLSYFAGVLSMAALLHLYASSETYDAFGYKLATVAWRTINGDSSSRPELYQTFTFYLKVALATCVPFVVAFAMTFFSCARAAKSSKE